MKNKDQIVLFGVLNWGFGHATRSIPIIDSFLQKNCKVHIASDGDALEFLKKEYPELTIHELPGYGVSYPYLSILLNIFKSSFSILTAIRNEYLITKKLVAQINPNVIVSDNRYGFRSNTVKSILISHQVNIQLGNIILSKLADVFNHFLIKKFDELWIPDYNDQNRLAGKLSLPLKSMRHKYIGPLSRFKYQERKLKYDIAVVLSGPEPQRTKFEKIILKQMAVIGKESIVIRGKLSSDGDYYLNSNVLVRNYVLSKELNDIINESELVISRSGYSTIMDMVVLGKKAIFVPTPGQTEQEYLAKYLGGKKLYYFQKQEDFNLMDAIENVREYIGGIEAPLSKKNDKFVFKII